jgi:phosphatidylglycerophosphate synthase
VQRGPAAGLLAQGAVLGVLGAGVGLHAAGWLAGSAYALLVWAFLTQGLHRSGARVFGPANAVTLGRATLVGGVTALTADSLKHPTPLAVLVTLATVALILDGVDGKVARRTGTTSPLGARFDGEIDAFLILMLSVVAAGSLGGWVLAIGAYRYLFLAAGWVLPWLNGSLPRRFSRSFIAAIQGVVLVVAASGLVPTMVMATVVATSLALLTWSFARDVRFLWRASYLLRHADAELARVGAEG